MFNTVTKAVFMHYMPVAGLVCISISLALVGVILYLQKNSLLGEVTTHTMYPGLVIGYLFVPLLNIRNGFEELFVAIIAIIFSFFGIALANRRAFSKKQQDQVLVLILSGFMGLGLFFLSILQSVFPSYVSKISSLFYGEAATLVACDAFIFLIILVLIAIFIGTSYKYIQMYAFDLKFMRFHKKLKMFYFLQTMCICLTIVYGIKAVGVVVVGGLLIAPVVAARALSHTCSPLFILAGFFGGISTLASYYIGLSDRFQIIPVGPIIVVIQTIVVAVILICSPLDGLLFRIVNSIRYKIRKNNDHVLKSLWKCRAPQSFQMLKSTTSISGAALIISLMVLRVKTRIELQNECYILTSKGEAESNNLVRLHRLWEVYLAHELDGSLSVLHATAEEFEHLTSPEYERMLSSLLKNPKHDPHKSPIPSKMEK